MEKSHHAAKAATQCHTQHGGTSARTSIILQQYQHWYRNIQHRYARKAAKELADSQHPAPDLAAIAAVRRRREAWSASSAASGHQAWREGCIRHGRSWVSNDKNVDLDDELNCDLNEVGGTNDIVNSSWSTEEEFCTDLGTQESDLVYEEVVDITR